MMLLLLSACGFGTISWPGGSEPLETAFFLEVDDPDTPALYVVLANSYIQSCTDPYLRDDSVRAEEEIYMAVGREGAQLIILELNRYGVDTWAGGYPMASQDFQPNNLSGANPFIAQGTYLGIEEAALDQDEGLYRSYTVTEAVFAPEVRAPGEVLISGWEPGELLTGQLRFESLDVSASFHAQPCNESFDRSLFPYVAALPYLFPTSGEDEEAEDEDESAD